MAGVMSNSDRSSAADRRSHLGLLALSGLTSASIGGIGVAALLGSTLWRLSALLAVCFGAAMVLWFCWLVRRADAPDVVVVARPNTDLSRIDPEELDMLIRPRSCPRCDAGVVTTAAGTYCADYPRECGWRKPW